MGLLSDVFKKKEKIQYEVKTSTQPKPRYFKSHNEASQYMKKELENGSGSASLEEVPVSSNKRKKLLSMS